jgi:glycosyltransferase involved in cell wall biosynthesis
MPQAFGKPAIIIPAFNEEECIGRTIELVKATGIDARIIVVNDGSKDRTAGIAREKEVEVISLPKNFGKANAFFLQD